MIMENSFIHSTTDTISLVILVCNKKFLPLCPTKINMKKRGFSQTWIN